jgi:hypothetical protein
MWEYLAIEVIGEMHIIHGRPPRHIDEYGKIGWELVSVTTQGEMHVAYFKREIDADSSVELGSEPVQ